MMHMAMNKPPSRNPIKEYVVVRTYSAGVHCGELVSREGREVTLAHARRIWRWKGAFTLHAVAAQGVGPGTQISVEIPSALLTEAIEVLTTTPAGEASLRGATWTP
jgi:hypothetical protein